MRTYDIPYVPNPARTDIIPGLETLDLRTITRTYLCGKSHGKVSECMRCPAQCAYGKRAIELLSTPADVPMPVQGKTMLEKAREEVAKQRTKTADEKQAEHENTANRKKYKKMKDWYEQAYNSDEPLKWIMNTFNISERKAKQKVYAHQHLHPELRETMPMWDQKKNDKDLEEAKGPTTENETRPVREAKSEKEKDNSLLGPLEDKINILMNKQEEYKKQIEYYQKLYQETKTKVDALYEALSILNE